MAVIDIGSDASNRSNGFGVATFVTLNNPANDTGVLDTFEVYLASNVSGLKIGTFSKSDTNFTPRDFEGIGTAYSGSKQTFTGKNCDVSSGDYLGVYYASGKIEKDDNGGDGVYYYASGDGFGDTYSYTLISGDIMSAYATGATAAAGVNATSNDSSAITENTGFRFSAWNATKSDTVAVTENVSLYTKQKYASTFDTLAVTDVANLYTKQVFGSTDDSIAITDEPSLNLVSSVSASTYDEIAITEEVSQNVGQQYISAFEFLEVTESNEQYLGQQYITASDNIEVTDEPSQNVGQQFITASDSIEVTEDNPLYLGQHFISAYDKVIVTDEGIASLLETTLLATASDGIAVTEGTDQYLSSQHITADDSIVVEDYALQNVGQQFISTGDDIVVTEDSTANIVSMGVVSINAYEDVGIVEAAEQYFKQKYATTNDSTVISDAAILYLKQLRLNASDNIAVTERINISGIGTFTPRRKSGLLMGVYP